MDEEMDEGMDEGTGEGLAVVTGGNKGIGRAVAARLVRAGHPVVVTGRDTEALQATVADLGTDGDVTAAAFDVTDEDAVQHHLGGTAVDVLVNNAGVGFSAPLTGTTLADWERVLAVNLTGAFLCTRAVLPGMRERDRGRVVTVASVASHRAIPYTAAYAASKHGVLGLMRATAAEVAGTGVTANAVCPAFVDTAMTDESVQRIVEATGREPDEAEQILVDQSPLGRLIDPDEVAAAVAYLVSADAAAVNGQTIVIDGGGVQS